EIRLAPLARQTLAEGAVEEGDQRRNAARFGRLRHVRGGSDAEAGDAARDEVLQEVTVVAGELDDEALRAEAETRGDRLDVAAGMLEPGVRVGGKIGVLGEDLRRFDVLLKLHEEAAFADLDDERVEGFGRFQAIGRDEALAGRRQSEIHDLLQLAAAESAARGFARSAPHPGEANDPFLRLFLAARSCRGRGPRQQAASAREISSRRTAGSMGFVRIGPRAVAISLSGISATPVT